jgi:hypothetical protein
MWIMTKSAAAVAGIAAVTVVAAPSGASAGEDTASTDASHQPAPGSERRIRPRILRP